MRSFNYDPASLRRFRKDQDIGDDDTPAVGGGRSATGAQHVSELADLLVEAGAGKIDRPWALAYLLHSKHGRALSAMFKSSPDVQKMFKRQSPSTSTTKEVTMTRTKKLADIAKTHGAMRLAKFIVDEQNGHGISEHELCKMFTDNVERRAGESPA